MESVNEISMDGFKVISGDYFYAPLRMQAPAFTIWDNCIGFSKQDLILLNNCECILLRINVEERKMLVIPTSSKDKDAIRWLKRLEPLEARKINCPKLTDSLYESWNWDRDYIYRTTGKLVTSGNKVMLMFDFSNPERWKKPEAKNV